ncbi:MAG: site-2 protease family protein, partial [Ilumatobacteraceae bacterium]
MTLSLGRIAGIPVRLHWSALLVAAYLAYSLGSIVSLVAVAVGVVCFGLSILFHELGHALVASRCGVATTSIDLWALGGVARLASEAPAPKEEAMIAAAGP